MQFPEIIWYVIVPTAILTSVVTAGLVYFLALKLYYDKIEKPIDNLPDRIALKV